MDKPGKTGSLMPVEDALEQLLAMAEALKMGIEAAYPPFNNKDASGNVVGFDKDIGDALCAMNEN